jgi:hypothetical protein
MSAALLTLDDIDHLTGGRLGTHDVPCPSCGPQRRAAVNRRRRVLRVWRIEPGYATWHCARCGGDGYARDTGTARRPLDHAALARVQAEAAERERVAAAKSLAKARRLWVRRRPIAGSIAERYLREARGYGGPLPATLGFLPASDRYPPAMIAAFGLAHEVEPGVIAIDDGAVSEGIEDGLSVASGSGLPAAHRACRRSPASSRRTSGASLPSLTTMTPDAAMRPSLRAPSPRAASRRPRTTVNWSCRCLGGTFRSQRNTNR